MRGLIDRLFPKDVEQKPSSRLVERGLEALRLARDEHAVTMGSTRRVPSHFELRFSPNRREKIAGMGALSDMEFFFKDELMKDLAAESMRTFGDHTLHVRVADDPGLSDNELYAIVLNPERRSRPTDHTGGLPISKPDLHDDATLVLEAQSTDHETDESATLVLDDGEDRFSCPILRIRFPNNPFMERELHGDHWIIGRRGSSGTPLPDGFQKLDLDLPTTASREQIRLEIDSSSVLITRIGKGAIIFPDSKDLNPNESRRVELGASFFVEGVELCIDLA